jgi:hypothetical protein
MARPNRPQHPPSGLGRSEVWPRRTGYDGLVPAIGVDLGGTQAAANPVGGNAS